jgi:hypothetical protein
MPRTSLRSNRSFSRSTFARNCYSLDVDESREWFRTVTPPFDISRTMHNASSLGLRTIAVHLIAGTLRLLSATPDAGVQVDHVHPFDVGRSFLLVVSAVGAAWGLWRGRRCGVPACAGVALRCPDWSGHGHEARDGVCK